MARTKTGSKKSGKRADAKPAPETYRHPDSTSLLRPDVGTQAQFKKKKPPVTYRYDSSLSPVLEWDGQNVAREKGEELIARILDEETVWDHLAGTISAPLEAGEQGQIAVKVIDDRGNELPMVKSLP